MNILTVTEAINLAKSGKKIKWQAPIYRHNTGYFGDGLAGGIAKIMSVFKSISNDQDMDTYIIRAGIYEGDDMNSIKAEGNPKYEVSQAFWYTDSDRFVTFEEL